jgi:hypothetical protein
MIMYIEAVVICVNYSDYLAHTLPASRSVFDNMVVVTSTTDVDTVLICNKYNVRCLQTDAFYEDGASFNKGAGINVGLAALSKKSWVVHLDADIYLPAMTRFILERVPLNQKKIYGIDRLMCESYSQWIEYLESTRSLHESWTFAHLNLFPGGSRIVQYGDYIEDGGPPDGWVPIGFFQLWHPGTSGVFDYPERHAAADRTDVLHTKKWKRADRELIPELVSIHLDSVKVRMGENWNGRRTPKFTAQTTSRISLRIRFGLFLSSIWRRIWSILQLLLFGNPTYR